MNDYNTSIWYNNVSCFKGKKDAWLHSKEISITLFKKDSLSGPKKPRPIIWIFYIRLLSNLSLKC